MLDQTSIRAGAITAVSSSHNIFHSSRWLHFVGDVTGRIDELSLECKGKDPAELVFPARDGGYLPRPKSQRGWFAGAVTRAKVQRITPHDSRHTCASLAVSAGVNVLALQRMLGHKSAKVTLDTYADLFDDDLDAVAVTLHSRYSLENAATGRPAWHIANTQT